MNKFLLFINIIILALLAHLYYMQFSHGDEKKSTPKKNIYNDSTRVNINSEAKIAYVNTDSLWANYEYVKEMQDEIKAEKLKMEGRYNSELKKLEKEFIDFQEKARYMTQSEGEKRQKELMEKEQEMMKLEQELGQKLLESEKEKNKLLQEKINTYIAKFNSEYLYSYILGYSYSSGNVLYADSSLDVTNVILAGLNAEYLELKPKKK